MRPEDLPLRPRKFAQTKLGLLWALVDRLDTRTLDEVQVRELCETVGISEASFFNYFPKKSDLLVYFVQIWTIDVAWHALLENPGQSAKDAITRIFDVTAEQVSKHPGVMAEVLAGQARLTERPELIEISLAERVVAFPERMGIADVPARGLDSLLPELLTRAVRSGELPKHTEVRSAFLGLSALFFGVPLIMRRVDPKAVGAMYREQLAVYWAGLEARAPAGKKPSKVRSHIRRNKG